MPGRVVLGEEQLLVPGVAVSEHSSPLSKPVEQSMESMVLAERIVWQSSKRMGNPTDNIRGSIVRYIRLEICTDKNLLRYSSTYNK